MNQQQFINKHGQYWTSPNKCPRLPQTREQYFKQLVRNKRVLHIGCANHPFPPYLHKHLDPICQLDGLDNDQDSINQMRDQFRGTFYTHLTQVTDNYDIILAPEIVEHLDNPGNFLNQINQLKSDHLVISAPDCYMCMLNQHFQIFEDEYYEAVHPDHVAWYSPHTLSNLIHRNTDFKVFEMNLIHNSIICQASRPQAQHT